MSTTTTPLRHHDRVDTPDGPGTVYVEHTQDPRGWGFGTRPRIVDGNEVTVVLDEAYFWATHNRPEHGYPRGAHIDPEGNPYARTYSRRDVRLRDGGVSPMLGEEAVREFIAAHRDARHGAKVAAKRKRDRERLPRAARPRRLTPAQAEREMRANWSAYGRGAYPGTPAEQAERAEVAA